MLIVEFNQVNEQFVLLDYVFDEGKEIDVLEDRLLLLYIKFFMFLVFYMSYIYNYIGLLKVG